MRRDGLDLERAQHHRQDERGGGLRVVDHDAKAARADRDGVERREEVLDVRLHGARREGDAAHLVPRRAAKLLAEEVLLHLLDEPRGGLDAGRLEDLELERLRIGAARADVPPAGRPSVFMRWRVTAAGITWRSATSMPVEMIPETTARLRRRQAGGAAWLVATRAPRSSAVPSAIPIRRAVSGVRSTLMRPVIESRPKSRDARRPDEVAVDERTGLDLLERVDPDARHDHRLVAERAVVADGRARAHARVRGCRRSVRSRRLDESRAPHVGRGVDH